MRKSTIITIAGVVAVAVLLSVILIFFKDELSDTDVSTAPTVGMDFSFDDGDIAASYDESDVVSVIQGDPISAFPSEDESSEDISEAISEESDASYEDSSYSDTDSSVADIPSKPEDSSVADTPSEPEDSSVAEDSSEEVPPAPAEDIYITTAGTHELKGAFTNRMIIVEVAATEKVQLVLKGVVINNANGPAIVVKEADKVTITAFDGTENYVSDGNSYTLTSGTTNVDAAIFSLADMTINGTGKLTVKGNKQHGVVSKDRVVVSECTLNISSKGIALNGKDYVKIKNGAITINSGDDGITSDNTENAAKGYIYIEGGAINVTAVHDGIQAETVLKSDVASITVKSGGGGSVALGTETAESYKGLKAVSDILISGGSYNISSRDDCIHSNGTISITGGTLTLSSGNDAFHANSDLAVSGGTITVENSFEGMDASRVIMSGGAVTVNASDDGIMTVNAFTLTGGTLYIDADGDGIDSNGTLQVRGGVMVISGPTSDLDSSLDCAGSSVINGGVVVALGSAPMAQGFSNSPSQGTAFCKFKTQAANTLLTLRDSEGNAIVAISPDKAYSSAVISAPSIKKGGSYTLMAGGNANGLDSFGFAQNTTCTGGELIMNVTMKANIFQGGSTN